jgi:hypothetical protein
VRRSVGAIWFASGPSASFMLGTVRRSPAETRGPALYRGGRPCQFSSGPGASPTWSGVSINIQQPTLTVRVCWEHTVVREATFWRRNLTAGANGSWREGMPPRWVRSVRSPRQKEFCGLYGLASSHHHSLKRQGDPIWRNTWNRTLSRGLLAPAGTVALVCDRALASFSVSNGACVLPTRINIRAFEWDRGLSDWATHDRR